MSTIMYNGVVLRLLTINEVSRQSVFSEDGTTYLYTEWLVDVLGQYDVSLNVYKPGPQASPGQAGQNPYNPAMPVQKGGTAIDWQGVSQTLQPPQSPTLPGNPNAVNLGSPVLTDKTVRHYLMAMRRTLIMTLGDPLLSTTDRQNSQLPGEVPPPSPNVSAFGANELIWLQSPLIGTSCDAKNGPEPIRCDVISVIDPTNFSVRFAVRTWVNECQHNANTQGTTNLTYQPLNALPPAAPYFLLSNRFQQTHDVNEDGYTTITTTGVAEFRTDWQTNVANIGARPTQTPQPCPNIDFYRRQLFLPVPSGFKRLPVQVNHSSDNTKLVYSYIDVEQPVNFVGANRLHPDTNNPSFQYATNAMRISLTSYRRLSKEGDASIQGFQGAAATARANAAVLSPVLGAIGRLGSGVASGPAAATGAALSELLNVPTLNLLVQAAQQTRAGLRQEISASILPKYEESVECKVWGNRYSRRADLYFLALSAVFGKMRSAFSASSLPEFSLEVFTDHVNKYVQVNLTYRFAFTLTGASGVLRGMASLLTGGSDNSVGGDWPFGNLIRTIFNASVQGSAQIPGGDQFNYNLAADAITATKTDWSSKQAFVNKPVLPDAGKPILANLFSTKLNSSAPVESNLSLNPLPPGDHLSYGSFLGPTLYPPVTEPCQVPPAMSAMAYQNNSKVALTGSSAWDYVRLPVTPSAPFFIITDNGQPPSSPNSDDGFSATPQSLPNVPPGVNFTVPQQFQSESPLAPQLPQPNPS